jgi:hypothetical protein
VSHQDVPYCDAKFPGNGNRRFVAAASGPAAWEVLHSTSDFSTTFDFVTPKKSQCDPENHAINSDDLAHLLMGETKVKQTKNQQFSKRKPINSRRRNNQIIQSALQRYESHFQ